MSEAPSTLPRSVSLVHVRLDAVPRAGDAGPREASQRLAALRDEAALAAAALALVAKPDSRRERAAWAEHCSGAPPQIFDDVMTLDARERLPWLEHFARALAPGAVPTRHALVDAARRVMAADNRVLPLDQLRWVALRHLLAGSAVAAPAAARNDFGALDAEEAHTICVFSAFLSRVVPAPEWSLDEVPGQTPPGEAWYRAVTSPWQDRIEIAPREEGRDIDAALRALRALQSLPWLLRPVLVRSWFDAARELTDGPGLHADAADALRLACVLLDSPVPPELAQQYVEVQAASH